MRIGLKTIMAVGLSLATTASWAASIVQDGGFESPSYGAGGWSYDPATTATQPWIFSGNSGIAALPSVWDSRSAPEGSQVGFMQGTHSVFYQPFTVSTTGYYNLTWLDAGRQGGATYGGNVSYGVTIDGVAQAYFTVTGGGFTAESINGILLTAGTPYNLTYAVGTANGDQTAFIDNVNLVSAPDGGSTVLMLGTALTAIGGWRMRRVKLS